ncbi:GntR family transcriptional regulator [Arthrobacter glacialis]|uniref:GntR family transcriptional regulator n=2 Tax=Arthrobacter glacialis TaxID=1664 RepID=A0A2S3ZX67_ARTGL|nr:GntR family transcriptional regulator [Arthrobacter glacialis]POH73800.1 GntR family transcriptional regulator [Arthrobacter glacialis]
MKMAMHQQLRDEFRHRIDSGSWPEGQPVPSEAVLCQEFGASRGPVRQALAALRQDGAISGGRGKPPVVRPAVISQSVETFLSFTQWAESMGRVPGQQTQEITRRPAGPVIADQLGLQASEPVVSLLRLRLLDGEPAMVERSHFVPSAGRALFDFDTDSGSTFSYLLGAGVDLHSARHTIDAVAADTVDAELLGIAKGAPLLRERRVTFSSTGDRLEYADDRYRPELANFMINNTLHGRTPVARVQSTTTY